MKQPNPSKLVGMASGAAKTVKRAGMQEALLKSEEWLRLAAEGSPMGLWYWNEETGRVFWDAKSCEIFGVNTEGEKTLGTFYGSLHPDDVERVRQVWRYQLEHGLPCDVEYRVIRPDGNMRWVHARGSGYYLNPALTPLFLSEFALKSAFAPKIYAAVDRFSPE